MRDSDWTGKIRFKNIFIGKFQWQTKIWKLDLHMMTRYLTVTVDKPHIACSKLSLKIYRNDLRIWWPFKFSPFILLEIIVITSYLFYNISDGWSARITYRPHWIITTDISTSMLVTRQPLRSGFMYDLQEPRCLLCRMEFKLVRLRRGKGMWRPILA